MKYWKGDRRKFEAESPYKGPYLTAREAESWAEKIRAVHTDAFRVIEDERGFHVEQDLPEAPHG